MEPLTFSQFGAIEALFRIHRDDVLPESERTQLSEAHAAFNQALLCEDHTRIAHFDAVVVALTATAIAALARCALNDGDEELADVLVSIGEQGVPQELRADFIDLFLFQ